MCKINIDVALHIDGFQEGWARAFALNAESVPDRELVLPHLIAAP
jgi:methionine aminopeptidase